ncbi:MAG: porin family protein [Bacteroidia bacterium]|jgi:hypothetical protein
MRTALRAFWLGLGLVVAGGWFCVPSALAQNNAYYDTKAFHFGFHVGINRSSHHLLLKDSLTLPGLTNLNYVSPVFGPGFQLGIVSDARLHEYLALRFTPTLMFSQRNFLFDFANQSLPVKKSVQMANVDLPLTLKFRSKRMKDYRVYVLGGIKASIDMASQEKVVDDVDRVKLRRMDYSVETGVGLDLYLQYFKLSPEIKVANGLRNVMVPEQHVYANFIQSLRSRTWIVSFTFE